MPTYAMPAGVTAELRRLEMIMAQQIRVQRPSPRPRPTILDQRSPSGRKTVH